MLLLYYEKKGPVKMTKLPTMYCINIFFIFIYCSNKYIKKKDSFIVLEVRTKKDYIVGSKKSNALEKIMLTFIVDVTFTVL